MYCDVYFANVSGLSLEKALKEASSNRREKAEKYRFAKDKRLCLGAEKLLIYALSERNTAFSGYSFGEHNKPYIDGVFFNFSHSGEYAVCAVSDAEVGCDIEKIEQAELKIAERFFTQDEYLQLKNAPENEKNAAFFGIWTLKESFIKAIGAGLSFQLRNFRVSLNEPLPITYNGKKYHFTQYEKLSGYKLCVCTEGEMPVRFIKTELR